MLCERLKVSRSGYYKWCNKEVSNNEKHSKLIAKEIKRIFEESKMVY